MPFRRAAPNFGTQGDGAEVAHQHRGSVLGGYGNILEIGDGPQITEAANHVFRAARLKHVAADFVGALAHAIDHGRRGNSIGEELVRVEIDLILAHKSANARDLRHAADGFKLIAQIPILQRAQIGKASRVAAVDDGVFVHPACAGCIGADRGMHICRKAA